MDFFTVLNQIVVLFLLLVIGYVAKKFEVFDDKTTKGLVSLLLKVSLPAWIIVSMQNPFDMILLRESAIMFGLSFLTYGLTFLIAWYIPRLIGADDREKGVFQFMLMFSNVGFMGYPVIEAILGKDAIFHTAIYNMPFNLLVFSIGIIMLRGGFGKEGNRFNPKMLLNPGIIAVTVGFSFFILSIKLPSAIEGTLRMIGSTTTPMSMIIVGALLSKVKLKEVFTNKRIYIISFCRLLVLPLCTWLILRQFITNPIILGVPVIISGMPAAANTSILAAEYGGEAELASQGVSISSLFSIITIPLLALLVT